MFVGKGAPNIKHVIVCYDKYNGFSIVLFHKVLRLLISLYFPFNVGFQCIKYHNHSLAKEMNVKGLQTIVLC